MDEKDVGKYFTENGEDIWELIAYCRHPTATLRNLKTGETKGGAVGSLNLKDMVRLKPEEA